MKRKAFGSLPPTGSEPFQKAPSVESWVRSIDCQQAQAPVAPYVYVSQAVRMLSTPSESWPWTRTLNSMFEPTTAAFTSEIAGAVTYYIDGHADKVTLDVAWISSEDDGNILVYDLLDDLVLYSDYPAYWSTGDSDGLLVRLQWQLAL